MIRLIVPEFINRVEIRKTRKPAYLTLGRKLPKKYQTNEYAFSKGVLVARRTGLPVVTNQNVLSKPTYLPVNGQYFYKGFGSPHTRGVVVNAIKDFLRPFVLSLPKLTGPLSISTELHVPLGAANWDVDNLWIYNKCFQDLLTECKKLPDDNVKHITCAGKISFFPVSLETERKLVYVIEADERQCIINHPTWRALQLSNLASAK